MKKYKKYLKDSTRNCRLYKKYTELGRLLKPNGLIIKPIFCVYVLKHTMPEQPAGFDWNDWEAL